MLFESEYKTINAMTEGEFRDRGSRFMAYAYPVKDESEIKNIVSNIRKEQPKANHHCYAYRLGPGNAVFRYSDDREPSGSAGKPIYGVIQANDLTDVLIVVTRYFGGTLLGIPGLINAYREAAANAIKSATIISKQITEKYKLIFGYELLKDVMLVIRQSNLTIISQQMLEECTIVVEVDKLNADIFYKEFTYHYALKNKCKIIVV